LTSRQKTLPLMVIELPTRVILPDRVASTAAL
jgi:hypothetical protein